MDLAEKLDEFIYKDFIDTLPTLVADDNAKKFVIDNDGKADWAVRKIIKYQNEIDNITVLAQERIEQTKKWQEEATAELERSIQFFKIALEPYAKTKLIGKGKTVKLPSGNVSFRSVNPGWFIAGEDVKSDNVKLTEYVEQSAPKYLNVKKSANWADFKNTLTVTKAGQVITADGEILGFISAVEYPDSVTIKERK